LDGWVPYPINPCLRADEEEVFHGRTYRQFLCLKIPFLLGWAPPAHLRRTLPRCTPSFPLSHLFPLSYRNPQVDDLTCCPYFSLLGSVPLFRLVSNRVSARNELLEALSTCSFSTSNGAISPVGMKILRTRLPFFCGPSFCPVLSGEGMGKDALSLFKKGSSQRIWGVHLFLLSLLRRNDGA